MKELIQYWNLESTMIKSRIEDTYKLYNMDAVSVGFLKKKFWWGVGVGGDAHLSKKQQHLKPFHDHIFQITE